MAAEARSGLRAGDDAADNIFYFFYSSCPPRPVRNAVGARGCSSTVGSADRFDCRTVTKHQTFTSKLLNLSKKERGLTSARQRRPPPQVRGRVPCRHRRSKGNADLSNPPECSHPQFVGLIERYRPLDRSCRSHRRPGSSPRDDDMSDADPRVAIRARRHVCIALASSRRAYQLG